MHEDKVWRELDQRLKRMQELGRISGHPNLGLPIALFALEFLRQKYKFGPSIGSLSTSSDVLQIAREMESRLFWEDAPFSQYLLNDLTQLDPLTTLEWLNLVDHVYTQCCFESWLQERLYDLEFPWAHETPREVARLMASLPGRSASNNEVFDPACGSGGLFLAAQKIFDPDQTLFVGREANGYACSWAKVRLAVNGAKHAEIELGPRLKAVDIRDEWERQRRRFDVVLTNPPFGIQIPIAELEWLIDSHLLAHRSNGRISSELAYLLSAYEHLDNLGTAAVLVPNGVLFRAGTDIRVRRSLVKQGAIAAVIALPARLFAPVTAIETCIVVLRRPVDDQDIGTLFVDASTLGSRRGKKNVLDDTSVDQIARVYDQRLTEPGFSSLVSKTEIEAKDCLLTPSTYVKQPADIMVDNRDRRTEIAELDAHYIELLDEYETLRSKL
ncbi:hypothetical protein AGRHK599_LOCUS141 [Rhizobium rhizogenes]|uniref:site-specific DNA-methyltransferase (adenine-specific) n=1 Tax=Rhizobium rhizogenes TaxID=359 RepID=A0AAN2DBI2_RHIRH|nr:MULTISPECIES: SAM-dependent methyltransferase [Rhizobium/Agrobacterium group]MCZ7441872.1 SAM-dependent methyltransferase [Rhizobium rhizogenes]NSZ77920.1 SAM-dependent methyltransferase [Agrobacterium tumefaciens]CAD0210128.1 hypothetical protein AGRHK599_LOCUS141 [Rhizobium rhizogenes]